MTREGSRAALGVLLLVWFHVEFGVWDALRFELIGAGETDVLGKGCDHRLRGIRSGNVACLTSELDRGASLQASGNLAAA